MMRTPPKLQACYQKMPFTVSLIERSGPWLAALNSVPRGRSTKRTWELVRYQDEREFEQRNVDRNTETFAEFVLLALELKNLEKQMRWVAQNANRWNNRPSCQISLAIVAHLDLDHDSQRKIEQGFRAAGAVACSWKPEQVNSLARLIDRYGETLPAQEISYSEFIINNLPWSSADTGNLSKCQK